MGAKHRKGDYFSESRKHFDRLQRDFEKLQMSPQMHVEKRKEFYGKSISEYIYDNAYAKTCMELQQQQQRAQQDMAIDSDNFGPGSWRKIGWGHSKENSARMRSGFWHTEFSPERGENVWRLNRKKVASELKRIPKSVYQAIRHDERAFDNHFGPGAFKRSYGKPDPRAAPPPDDTVDALKWGMGQHGTMKKRKVARDAAHVTQLIRPQFRPTKMMTPFEVGDPKRSVARQLELDHNAHMADGGSKGEMFHVEHDESLLEALQRHFDIWTTGKHTKNKLKKPVLPTEWRNLWTTGTSGTYTGMDLAGPHSLVAVSGAFWSASYWKADVGEVLEMVVFYGAVAGCLIVWFS